MIIGLDVGGTHTDVVLLDSHGLVNEIKVYTDSTDLFSTVLDGLKKITHNVDPKLIKRVVLSTTLTTNFIVQGTLPEVGMIVSSGPGIDPMLFKTNGHYYPVSGSIDHRGRRVEAIDHNEVKNIGNKLRADGVRQLGIVGKFSARNPSHELEIRRILKGKFDDFFLGHRVSGNLNFQRRIATTYLNAAVYPIHKHFFQAVKKSLDQQGLKVPIHILKADGGTMNFESSIHFPGQTILSGPAASVMGATAFAPAEEDLLVFDIGGTTTDMAILIDRAPLLDPVGIELGKYKTLIRALKTRSIGIGGDSVVRFKAGEIEIGPDRAGYAMAYGGTKPTPTDALAVMGKMTDCDRDKARKGLEPIASEMGISVEEAAQKIFDRACCLILKEADEMVDQINSKPVYTVHELQEGYHVKPKKILVLGGPAPYFAEHLEKISEYTVTAIPSWKVANAIGAALARTTCEVTLFADTERGILTAPEEKFKKNISRDFTRDQAVQQAYELLKQKALQIGASSEDLEMEILEDQVFNMVRGFQTTGRNIRIKAQVKPGLIQRYEDVVEKLSLQSDS
ncbi:MAG: hydantoinase/oxoprolinase family protein [Deltaproteobacteria bacterium]|nr:hydantoinase/oxoprolinase family protein [Deltaproteobacteria bacterium]